MLQSVNAPSDTCYEAVTRILRSALEAIQASSGAVNLISAEHGGLQSYISHGLPSGQLETGSVARWVATHKQPLALTSQEEALLVTDLAFDKREPLPIICAPILVNDAILGTLQAYLPSVSGREELWRKVDFLKLTGELIGYAIENVNLRRQVRQTEGLRQSRIKIRLDIQEKELERISLELHDGVAQTLASAFLYLQTIDIRGFQDEQSRRFFTRAVALIKQAIQEMRGVMSNGRLATLDPLGLVPTLQRELKQLEMEMECRVDFHSATWPELPREIEIDIYRIIREAINNVRRHAESPRLEVELRQEEEYLVIRVKDWGIGFTLAELEHSSLSHSLGLSSMRQRAELLGGTLTINSRPGKGTEVLVNIPWLPKE